MEFKFVIFEFHMKLDFVKIEFQVLWACVTIWSKIMLETRILLGTWVWQNSNSKKVLHNYISLIECISHTFFLKIMLFNSKKISPIFTTSMTYLPTPKSPNPLYSIIYIYLNGHTYFRKIFIKKIKIWLTFLTIF